MLLYAVFDFKQSPSVSPDDSFMATYGSINGFPQIGLQSLEINEVSQQ